MDLLPDERAILMAMIQIEDHGHGGYRSDPYLHQRLHEKGLERHGTATPLARDILGMPKPPPSPEEIATLRTWVRDGQCAGWQLDALNRRGLVDPFGEPTLLGVSVLND